MSLSESLKSQIQDCYREWLKNNNCKPRRSQREMIAHIARCIANIETDSSGLRSDGCDDQLCIVQAGTGTGKTLAYLITAITIAKELDKKVVLSTATVALQEQLLNKDLPNLADTTSLEFSYAIAKGRSRYLCLSKLQLRINEINGSVPPQGLFPDEQSSLGKSSKQSLLGLSKAIDEKSWDGDVDLVPDSFDTNDWHLVAADRNSCSGKQCSNYRSCYLFTARDEVRKADVVVANHDLVLADLVQGGGNVLPTPEETIYVFDEGHHLPDKSRSHLSSSISLEAQIKQIDASQKIFAQLRQLKGLSSHVMDREYDIRQLDEAATSILRVLKDRLYSIVDGQFHNEANVDINIEEGVYRFKNGEIGEELVEQFSDLRTCLEEKRRHLVAINTALSELLNDDESVVVSNIEVGSSDKKNKDRSSNGSIDRKQAAYSNIGQLLASIENTLAVSESYAEANQPEPYARWLAISEPLDATRIDINIYSVPLSTAEILRRILWSKCFASIVTSATLAPGGNFRHFYKRLGHGHDKNTVRLLGEFNYPEAVFRVPKMHAQPNNAALHTEEIIELIPELLDPRAGNLVLFSSRRQMEEVAEELQVTLEILVQGSRSKHTLLEAHKKLVDNGKQSILFGLASFAEGLDLPGDYCRAVIIAKLPFAVPDGPVDKAMGEWVESQGGNSFRDISLPDAAVRLMQATGRLLRKETDSGCICLLDRRIVEKSYGKQLLASLPPFTMKVS